MQVQLITLRGGDEISRPMSQRREIYRREAAGDDTVPLLHIWHSLLFMIHRRKVLVYFDARSRRPPAGNSAALIAVPDHERRPTSHA